MPERPKPKRTYWDGDYFDFRKWMYDNFRVLNDGKIVPFRERAGQKKLFDYIEKRRRAKKPVRVVIPKSRKLGFSTAIQGMILAFICEVPNLSAKMFAHIWPSTEEIYGMLKFGFDNLPESYSAPALVRGTKPGKRSLVFDSPHNSSYHAFTASRHGVGRGGTPRIVHMSEYAYWDDAGDTFNGIMESLPTFWDTIVIVESTACGKNDFYKLWKTAELEESEWHGLFWSWVDEEWCQEDVDPATVVELDLEWIEYQARHGLTINQIMWGRKKWIDNAKRDWDKYRKEQPCTAEEAFAFSGSPWFSAGAMAELIGKATAPVARGNIRWADQDSRVCRFLEDHRGPLMIWEYPIPGEWYSLGCDTGTGVGKDYSVIIVVKNSTREVVAKWRSNKITAVIFGAVCCQMGFWYNYGRLGIESNGIGEAALNVAEGNGHIKQLASGYPELHYHVVYDRKEKEEKRKHGVSAGRPMKDLTLARGQALIIDRAAPIPDLELLEEMAGYMYDPEKDNYDATLRDDTTLLCHDDQIDAWRIAQEMVEQSPDPETGYAKRAKVVNRMKVQEAA